MSEKLFHVGIKALITNKSGEILVLKTNTKKFKRNDSAHWDIPGGRIQVGQSVEETLRREIQEETGLAYTGQPVVFTSVISNIEIPISDIQTVGLVLMIYTVEPDTVEHIVLSDEHTEYAWVSPLEAAERLAFKYPAEFTARLATGNC